MYFENLTSPELVKTEFRRLAMKHHPDVGGDNDTMRIIIEEYHAALKKLDGYESVGTDGREHTYTYREAYEQAIIEKIEELLGLHLDGVEIWIVGTWIWVDGNTRPYKEALKKTGFTWIPFRRKWSWKPYHSKSRQKHTTAGFDSLCAKYGVRKIETDKEWTVSKVA